MKPDKKTRPSFCEQVYGFNQLMDIGLFYSCTYKEVFVPS